MIDGEYLLKVASRMRASVESMCGRLPYPVHGHPVQARPNSGRPDALPVQAPTQRQFTSSAQYVKQISCGAPVPSNRTCYLRFADSGIERQRYLSNR